MTTLSFVLNTFQRRGGFEEETRLRGLTFTSSIENFDQ